MICQTSSFPANLVAVRAPSRSLAPSGPWVCHFVELFTQIREITEDQGVF